MSPPALTCLKISNASCSGSVCMSPSNSSCADCFFRRSSYFRLAWRDSVSTYYRQTVLRSRHTLHVGFSLVHCRMVNTSTDASRGDVKPLFCLSDTVRMPAMVGSSSVGCLSTLLAALCQLFLLQVVFDGNFYSYF